MIEILRAPVPGYEWRPDAGEISGFGGSYELACRKMVSQGCKFIAENPDLNAEIHAYERVIGVVIPANADAEKLHKAMERDIPAGITGAMQHYSTMHVFAWKNRFQGSWPEYQAYMVKRKEAEDCTQAEEVQP